MSSMLFYGNPVPLNSVTHRQLKIAPAKDGMAFAAKTNSLPVVAVEFMEAAKEYPLVFAKAGDSFVPVALVGLRNEQNLMLNADGKWDARYIPAFARRYPFVLARNGAEGPLTVCVDETYPGLSETEGDALFDESGEQTPRLKEIITFLDNYHAQAMNTERFVQRLVSLDLLVELTAQINAADGKKMALAGLYVINEAKLLKVDDAVALEMFRSGELALAYSHLVSLSNLQGLVARLS